MFVQTAKNADAEIVRQQLQELPQISDRYSVFFEDTYSKRNNQLFKDIASLMNISSSLALLAVAFGTFTSTNLSLTERGREIGILRAIGFSHFSLGKLLGLRAILQSLLAFTAGFAASLAYFAYQQTFAQLFVLGVQITFKITWQLMAFGLLLTFSLALLGAWLSSRRMLRRNVNQMLMD